MTKDELLKLITDISHLGNVAIYSGLWRTVVWGLVDGKEGREKDGKINKHPTRSVLFL